MRYKHFKFNKVNKQVIKREKGKEKRKKGREGYVKCQMI